MNTVARRNGSALLLMLVVILIVESLIAVMLLATIARSRSVADERWAIEGELVAKTALAEARRHFATAAALPDGILQRLTGTRPDGWTWSVDVLRLGDLVRMSAVAERHRADGLPVAGSRVTLLLRRLASDTLQSLPRHATF